VIPGASPAAIEQAVRLATRVSVNIEAPSAVHMEKLSHKKRFHEDIIHAIKTISRLRQQINPRCKQTTQFVVGAADESDREIVLATDRLYQKFDMERIYFSAYQDFDVEAPVAQRMLFEDLPPEKMAVNSNSFMREHRLYQVDFLLRKYGFARDDIYFDNRGNLSLKQDPKLIWANKHPECFPVDVNRADREQLLRVPGIGPIGVKKILTQRRQHRFRYLDELRQLGIRTGSARDYLSLAR
jgi:predicted DNA-binding helix-hairpin-helix protein